VFEETTPTPPNSNRVFLTAKWRSLAMLNYEVDSNLLCKYVPAGVELDQWNGSTFMSLVGFSFLNTKVLGLPIPFHRNFEEVNLRFYVRRNTGSEIRRGVVFIKEIVPRWAIAFVARSVYGERYVSMPMSHAVSSDRQGNFSAEYAWHLEGSAYKMCVHTEGTATQPTPNSVEQFITEHYWGYSKNPNGRTTEYQVAHPPWLVWQANQAIAEGDFAQLYSPSLAAAMQTPPTSAFLAEGSAITVFRGHSI
jgi:uncharacterized protein YqjF (DUF2071 family)